MVIVVYPGYTSQEVMCMLAERLRFVNLILTKLDGYNFTRDEARQTIEFLSLYLIVHRSDSGNFFRRIEDHMPAMMKDVVIQEASSGSKFGFKCFENAS